MCGHRLQDPSSDVPGLHGLVGARNNDCGMDRTPGGAIYTANPTGQFDNRLENSLDPNPDEPVAATSEEYFRAERRVLHAEHTAIVDLKHCRVVFAVVYRAPVDATLIRAHHVDLLLLRMDLDTEGLGMPVTLDDLLRLCNRESFDDPFDAVEAH